jgi:hypothetical protein
MVKNLTLLGLQTAILGAHKLLRKELEVRTPTACRTRFDNEN